MSGSVFTLKPRKDKVVPFERRFSKRKTTVRKFTFGQEPETNESPTRRRSARLDNSSINALSSSSKQTLPEILRGLTLPSGTPEESEISSDLNYDLEPLSQSIKNLTKLKVQLKTKDDTSSSSGVLPRSSDTEQCETDDNRSSSSGVRTRSSDTKQHETDDNNRSSSSGVWTTKSETDERYDAMTDENISPQKSRQSPRKNISPQKSRQSPRKNISLQKSRQSPRKNISPQKSRQSSPRKNISPQKSRQSPRKNISPQKSRQSPRKNISPQKSRESPRNNRSPQKSRESPRKRLVDAFHTSSSRHHVSTAELPVNISRSKVWKTFELAQQTERGSDGNEKFVEVLSKKDSAENFQIPITSMDNIEQNEDVVESNHLSTESDVIQHNSVEDIFDTTDEQSVNNITSSVDDKDGRKRRTEADATMLSSPPKKHKLGKYSNFVSMEIDEADTDQEHVIGGQGKEYFDRLQHGDIEDIQVDSDLNEHDRMQHGDIEVDSDINEQLGEKRLSNSSKDNKVINCSKTDEVDDSDREVQDLSNKTMYDEIEDLQTNKTVHAEEVEDEGDDKSSEAENLRNDKNDEVAELCNDENGEEGEITTFCTIENVQSDNVDDSVRPDLILVSSGKHPFGKTPVKNDVKKKAKRVSDEKDSATHGQVIRMVRGQDRTARDVIDLDIVLDSMTSTIEEKRKSCDHGIKKSLNGLLVHTRKEFTNVIDCIEDLKIEKRDKTVQRREVKDLREDLHEVQQKKKSVMKKIEVKKDEGREKLKYINQWLMSMSQLMKTKTNIRSPRKVKYVTYGNFPDL